MVDFRNRNDMSGMIQQAYAARASVPNQGLSMVNSGLQGLQQGLQLSEAISSVMEKKKQKKLVNEYMQNGNIETLAKALAVTNPEKALELISKRQEKPLFEYDPQDKTGFPYKDIATQTKVSSVPANAMIRTKQLPYEVKTDIGLEKQYKMEEKKTLEKSKKEFNTYTSDATQTLTALDNIERASKEIGDFDRGIISQFYEKGKFKYKELAADPKVKNYLGTISQELIPAARKLMEEKGPITETDVARVEKGLGDATLPFEDKKKLLDQLRNKVKEAINNKKSVAGISDFEFKSKYKNLHDKINPSLNFKEMSTDDLFKQLGR